MNLPYPIRLIIYEYYIELWCKLNHDRLLKHHCKRFKFCLEYIENLGNIYIENELDNLLPSLSSGNGRKYIASVLTKKWNHHLRRNGWDKGKRNEYKFRLKHTKKECIKKDLQLHIFAIRFEDTCKKLES
jgi:hypothetical protein